jgi:ATP-dependent protease HslVU (ClpYQ) peptidase subunit
MTTVVTNGKSIAADSQVTADTTKEGATFKKIRRVNGELFGLAGDVGVTPLLWEWISSGAAVEDMLDLPTHEYEILRVTRSGVYYTANDTWTWMRVNRITGIGTGGAYAEVALKAGAPIRRAVQLAIEKDLFSGGKIHALNLG